MSTELQSEPGGIGAVAAGRWMRSRVAAGGAHPDLAVSDQLTIFTP
jgi:hypothetical protein